MKNFKVSSSTLEYAVLILIVAVALVTMSTYTRRALSGRWREVGDTFGFGRQYGRTVASARWYDCRTQHIFSCGNDRCQLTCWPTFICQPRCYSVLGFGNSNDSMREACRNAVLDALSQRPLACGNQSVNWCAWYTIQTTWNPDRTRVLSSRTVCPGQP